MAGANRSVNGFVTPLTRAACGCDSTPPVLELLQSQPVLIIGALLALITTLVARASKHDDHLRRDLRGAVVLLCAFMVLWLLDWSMPEAAPEGIKRTITVAWMLAFAWGCIRGLVSLGLKAFRWRTSKVTPKILRDVIDFTLYVLSTVPILKSQLNIDLGGLIATSAILSVVIGLALQDTLGNLFAGLSLQLERPYQVGEWVTIGQNTGRVVQIGWRATRIETFRREVITVPNNMVAKEAVRNFRGGLENDPVGIDLFVRVSYDVPPNRVQRAMREVLEGLNGILSDPPPLVRAWEFEESAIRYQVRYFVNDYQYMDPVKGEFYTQLWYRMKREGIDIPYPQRVLSFRETPAEVPLVARREVLAAIDLFAPLTEQQREQVLHDGKLRRFGRNESVIEEGDDGQTFYVVMEGEVSVRSRNVEIARLVRGGYFGEMSLLTGEARSASVQALDDALLLELDRTTFKRLFSENPDFARQLSAILAERRTQLKSYASAAVVVDTVPTENDIFRRLRALFALGD